MDYLRGFILDRLVLDDYFEELLHGMTGATFAYTKYGSYKPAGKVREETEGRGMSSNLTSLQNL
jgi:hypothetical protein